MSGDRMPPNSREAERCVLGSMLRDNGVIGDVVPILRDENFYLDAHQKIFKGVVALYDRGGPVDLVILAEWLKEQKHIEDVGGYAYLGELWDAAPTAANAEYYARIVRDKAIIRHLIHASTEILRDGYDQVMPADELLEKAERMVFDTAQAGQAGRTVRAAEAVGLAYDRIDERVQWARDGRPVYGLPSGLVDLDRLTGGFRDAELVILAARLGVGKTALACGIAWQATVGEGLPVLFVSLEQTQEEITERLLCREAKVDGHKLRVGLVSDEVLGLGVQELPPVVAR